MVGKQAACWTAVIYERLNVDLAAQHSSIMAAFAVD